MKRIVSVLYFLIINIVIIAQTQYDYYDDDVAHEKPVIDGYAILGLVILGTGIGLGSALIVSAYIHVPV